MHELEPLDEVPPEGVEIRVGVGVEGALEVRHHEDPSSEHEERGALRVDELVGQFVDERVVDRGDRGEPLGVARQATHQHRDALGGEGVGGAAQEPGERVVALSVVDGVSELVEHGVHPPLARFHVAQHAHIAGAVDVDAERVLALAVARVEVAAFEHPAHVEAEAVVGAHRECLEVGVREQVVQVDRAFGGWALEERIVEVPRA